MRLRMLALVTLLVGSVLGPFSLRAFSSDEKKAPAEEVKPKEINLKEAYSTNGQPGLMSVSRLRASPHKAALEELWKKGSISASNVFLVKGKDIDEAIDATRLVFIGGVGVDPPSGPLHSKARTYWAVVYFGFDGSEPPAWVVSKIERKGTAVTIKFSNPGAATQDAHQYFLWIPLGELSPGSYRIQLYDERRRETVLMRCTQVPME